MTTLRCLRSNFGGGSGTTVRSKGGGIGAENALWSVMDCAAGTDRLISGGEDLV
jgi:hypothetical protein